MKNNTTIYIDPRCNHVYASYYIKGLYDIYGLLSVKFTLYFFLDVNLKELIKCDDPAGGDDPRVMLFVVKTNNSIRKIVIDYRDKTNVFSQAYDWCDKYAKVNYDKNMQLKFKEKVFSIPPSFSTPYGNIFLVLYNSILNSWRCYIPKKRLMISFISFFVENTSSCLKRQSIQKYEYYNSYSNYVFFISSLWPYRNSIEYDRYISMVNSNRINYIELLKQNKLIEFEGGLYVYDNNEINVNKNILFDKRISHKQYIENTKKSMFVFNTPSVWGCHGWKLGEFLAMGKAIISTPLYNDLPEPLRHGENIHYISNKQDLYEAIEKIRSDNEYRHRLEQGARAYYEKYASPKSVINYIINYGK